MLSPKNVKYRKQFRGRTKGSPDRGNTLSFGDFGLQATECGYVNARQIEAARVALTSISISFNQTRAYLLDLLSPA